MSLFDGFGLGCMLKMASNLLQWRMVDMDDNSKLVAFRLSIWHYKVALDDLWSQCGMITLHKRLLMKRLGRGSHL